MQGEGSSISIVEADMGEKYEDGGSWEVEEKWYLIWSILQFWLDLVPILLFIRGENVQSWVPNMA